MESFWNDPWIEETDITLMRSKLNRLGSRWVFLLLMGLLTVALGVVALLWPVVTTVGLNFMLAALLGAGGLLYLIQAFRLRREDGSVGRFLQALLSIVASFLMFRFPEAGMMGIALTLGFYFFIRAALEWLLYASIPYVRERRWGYASAFMSFLLGVLVVAWFPMTSMWVPGLLLGLDLIFGGAVAMAFALALRKAVRDLTGTRRTIPIKVT